MHNQIGLSAFGRHAMYLFCHIGIGIHDLVPQVIGIQDCELAHPLEFAPVPPVECPSSDHRPSVAIPLLHLADAALPHILPEVPVAISHAVWVAFDCLPARSHGSREETREVVPHPYRSASRAPSPMRLAECLVEVVVYGIEAHPPRICLSDYCIEVGSVVVHLPPCFVYDPGCLRDICLE